ncbi:MAG: HpcH/HpaI aldolase/citrate lyase family protein [Rhizobiales bacterium]|nr:HpcH/HpaI aldolase/citrate lyase family protein [Hyphomicrobiales bacterium]
MEIQPNQFKAAIAAGKTQIGLWSTLCNPISAEIIANSGFDWLVFDSEHSPVEVAGLLPLLQATDGSATVPAVRPAWNDMVLIKKVLDIGARTILVPFVQNANEAASAVRSCRYPPDGVRGVAGATRASGYGRTKDYLIRANEEICVLVQVETGDAMARLSDIASTPGVDGVFIGPSDLAASMGHLGNPGHGDVQSAIRSASEIIKQAGKAPGILATNPDDARRYMDWGYLFVACGVDSSLLVKACDTLLKDVRV